MIACAFVLGGCRDVTRFDSNGDHYEGAVIAADFVRAGVDAKARLCLTLDTSREADAPGTITTSDGRFVRAALRPIAPIANDPLSTLTFGSGRTKSLLLAAHASSIASADSGADASASAPADVLVIVSLMDAGNVEVRFVAPHASATSSDGGAASQAADVFAVFPLERVAGACPFDPS